MELKRVEQKEEEEERKALAVAKKKKARRQERERADEKAASDKAARQARAEEEEKERERERERERKRDEEKKKKRTKVASPRASRGVALARSSNPSGAATFNGEEHGQLSRIRLGRDLKNMKKQKELKVSQLDRWRDLSVYSVQ